MSEINPCKCGADAYWLRKYGDDWALACKQCANTVLHLEKAKCIDNWNTANTLPVVKETAHIKAVPFNKSISAEMIKEAFVDAGVEYQRNIPVVKENLTAETLKKYAYDEFDGLIEHESGFMYMCDKVDPLIDQLRKENEEMKELIKYASSAESFCNWDEEHTQRWIKIARDEA